MVVRGLTCKVLFLFTMCLWCLAGSCIFPDAHQAKSKSRAKPKAKAKAKQTPPDKTKKAAAEAGAKVAPKAKAKAKSASKVKKQSRLQRCANLQSIFLFSCSMYSFRHVLTFTMFHQSVCSRLIPSRSTFKLSFVWVGASAETGQMRESWPKGQRRWCDSRGTRAQWAYDFGCGAFHYHVCGAFLSWLHFLGLWRHSGAVQCPRTWGLSSDLMKGQPRRWRLCTFFARLAILRSWCTLPLVSLLGTQRVSHGLIVLDTVAACAILVRFAHSSHWDLQEKYVASFGGFSACVRTGAAGALLFASKFVIVEWGSLALWIL